MASDPLSEDVAVDPLSSSDPSSISSKQPLLYLPDSVPDEFKDESFLKGIKAAKQTLGSVETGLSAKSEFELYFQTGPSLIDYKTLQKRAQNVDIRYSKIRSVYWKVFLSLIDNDTSSWIQQLKQKRDEYDKLKDKHINDAMKEDDDANNLVMDNPLLSTQGGKWDNFYKDTELRDTIILDIDRTYPEDEFFVNKIVQNSLTDVLFIYSKENQWISYKQGMNELIATLFMVNTVQSTISPYVDDDSKIPMDQSSDNQKEDEPDNNDNDNDKTEDDNNDSNDKTEANGTTENNDNNDNNDKNENNENNEDSAPPTKKDDDQKEENINNNDKDKKVTLWEVIQDIRYIEHDTYFMFSEIMSIMGQYFINAESKEVPPVVERSKRIQGQFLRQMDTQLAQHLLKINLTPQLYGLRWIRLFFSREFHLRDVCVVWDAIFGAYSERVQQTLKEQPKNKDNNNDDDIVDPVKAIDKAIEKKKIKLDFRFVDYMSCSMLLFIRHQCMSYLLTINN